MDTIRSNEAMISRLEDEPALAPAISKVPIQVRDISRVG